VHNPRVLLQKAVGLRGQVVVQLPELWSLKPIEAVAGILGIQTQAGGALKKRGNNSGRQPGAVRG
jgi:hypothetical protein